MAQMRRMCALGQSAAKTETPVLAGLCLLLLTCRQRAGGLEMPQFPTGGLLVSTGSNPPETAVKPHLSGPHRHDLSIRAGLVIQFFPPFLVFCPPQSSLKCWTGPSPWPSPHRGLVRGQGSLGCPELLSLTPSGQGCWTPLHQTDRLGVMFVEFLASQTCSLARGHSRRPAPLTAGAQGDRCWKGLSFGPWGTWLRTPAPLPH